MEFIAHHSPSGQVACSGDEEYIALIESEFSSIEKAAQESGSQKLVDVARSLKSELLTADGHRMLLDCYSGETPLSEWLDLVVRKRAGSMDNLPDGEYVRRLIAGDEDTIRDFLPRARGWLEARLFHVAQSGREREEARNVIEDVLSDLFGKGLLEQYGGKGSLPAWLCRVGKNRLLDALQKASFRNETEFIHDESGQSSVERSYPAPETPQIDPMVLSTLREGLACAFSKLPPRRLFLVRLVFLHGVQRQALAKLLNIHPSGIGREINETLETVTTSLRDFMRKVDPDDTLDLSDYVFLSDQFQAALHGEK